jgi:hypothetical protein
VAVCLFASGSVTGQTSDPRSSVSVRFSSLDDAVQAGVVPVAIRDAVRARRSPRIIAQLSPAVTADALAVARKLDDPDSTTANTSAAPETGPNPVPNPSSDDPTIAPGNRVGASQSGTNLIDGVRLRAELGAQKQEVLAAVGSGLVRTRDFSSLPAFATTVTSENELLELLNAPGIGRVSANEVYSPSLSASLPAIGQPAAVASGFTGAGTYVGVIDSGVDYTRAAFGSCVAPGGTCRVSHLPADFTRINSSTPYSDGMPDDTCATLHGTNVSGIIAGTAPGTKIVAADVFQPLPATPTRPYNCAVQGAYLEDILAAISYMVALKAGGTNIVAVNMSFGGGARYTSPCADDTQVAFLRSVGIQPVAAGGNAAKLNAQGAADPNGTYQDGVMNPACIPGVIAVGATNNVVPATFSQSAPLPSMIFAPGTAINAAGLTKSGTSMAAPHVAAAFAMASQARPGWNLDQRFQFLRDSATNVANLYVSRTEKSLNLAGWPAMLTPPPNDNRAAAIPAPPSIVLDAYSATAEAGEASHGNIVPTRTVWYRHTMTRVGVFSVESSNAIGMYSTASNAATSRCTSTTYLGCYRMYGDPGDVIDIAVSAASGSAWSLAAKFYESGDTFLQSTISTNGLTTLTINTQGFPGVPKVEVVDLLANPATNPYTAKVIARNAPNATTVGPFNASLVAVLVSDFPAISISSASGVPSDNDLPSSQFNLAGLAGSTDHTTVTATPTVNGAFDRDLWYQWVAPGSGRLLVGTAGSNVDTELCLTGPSGQDCNGATPNTAGATTMILVAANDIVSIRAGVPVGGVAQGTIRLNWRFVSDERVSVQSVATPAPVAPTRATATGAATAAPVIRPAAPRAPGSP